MNDRDIRRCLPIELWPEADKVAWAAAIAPSTVLDDTMGRGALWREPTRRRVSKCYGRWLSYLIVAGKLIPDDTPTSRIARETVRDYVTLLSEQVPPWIVAKLQLRRRPSKDKLSRMRAPDEIIA